MLEDPQLAPLALRQLSAWEQIADTWETWLDADVQRCGPCGKGLYLALDASGNWFRYTHEQILALTVLHLRNHHADLDPDKGL